MTKSQIDFDKEEDEIIECCKYLYSLNKKEAIKKLISIAGKTNEIKKILEEKKRLSKK
jgi:hypothetical protein